MIRFLVKFFEYVSCKNSCSATWTFGNIRLVLSETALKFNSTFIADSILTALSLKNMGGESTAQLTNKLEILL